MFHQRTPDIDIVMSNDAYKERYSRDNPNIALIHALKQAGVDIRVCGQGLLARKIDPKQVNPDVQIDLWAMTTLVNLQLRDTCASADRKSPSRTFVFESITVLHPSAFNRGRRRFPGRACCATSRTVLTARPCARTLATGFACAPPIDTRPPCSPLQVLPPIAPACIRERRALGARDPDSGHRGSPTARPAERGGVPSVDPSDRTACNTCA